MKITTEELKQIIVEELGNVATPSNATQSEGLAGTAEETVLGMRSKVKELRAMLLQAEERGIDRRYPEEYARAKGAYRQFNMAFQSLEGKVTSYISG